MARNIYGITPITSGLNNQRVALLGLIGTAYLEGAKVSLPKTLVDYSPFPANQQPAEHPTVPFASVFDEACLHDGLRSYDILSDQPATEILHHDDCFKSGSEYLSLLLNTSRDAQIVTHFLMSCRSAPELRDLANSALAVTGDRPPLMLQLRIERDWHDYLAKRPQKTDGIETMTDARKIFEKIARTHELSKDRLVLACCDESDLVQSREDLRKDARDFGLELMFKSDVEKRLDLPSSRLQRSAIDFEMCLLSDRYVGLSRSSFSNLTCLLKSIRTAPEHPEHYIYNVKSDHVVRRWDRGLHSAPDKAVKAPLNEHGESGATWAQAEMKRRRLRAVADLTALRRAKNGQIAEYKQKLQALGHL